MHTTSHTKNRIRRHQTAEGGCVRGRTKSRQEQFRAALAEQGTIVLRGAR